MINPKPDISAMEPSDDQVADYLRSHPDFLEQHPELLADLTPPSRWQAGSVVDMQHFMIQKLKVELEEMRACAEDLILTSRSNMSTQMRTHEAVLTLLAVTDMAHLAQVVTEELPPLLDVDVVTLCLESGPRPLPNLVAYGIRQVPAGTVQAGMQIGDVVLKSDGQGDPVLFGDGVGLVRSFALVRLDPLGPCPPGLLALGARQPDAFHPGQGTELLTFLARVMEYTVARWADN